MAIDLWTEASYDAEADMRERRFTAARVAVAPLWSFLAAAEHPRDFENRLAVVADRIDAACQSLASGAEFAVLRHEIDAALQQDFSILNEDRLRTEAKRRVAARKAAALKCPKCGSNVSGSAKQYGEGSGPKVLSAKCSKCGWKGTKTKTGAWKTAEESVPAGGAEAPDQDTERHSADTPEGGEHVGPKAECPICTTESGSDAAKTTEQVGQMSTGASRGRRPFGFGPNQKTASGQPVIPDDVGGRDVSPKTLAEQIGRMNIMAISGGRVIPITGKGDRYVGIRLPVSNGYCVDVYLADNDTYTVQRFYRGKVMGVQTDIYFDQVGEAAYQASSFRSNEFGGHSPYGRSGAKEAVIDDLRTRLVMAVTQYDRREEKRGRGYNIYALPQYLGAVDDAMKKIDKGQSPEDALSSTFTGRLLEVVLKAAAGSPPGGVFVRGGEASLHTAGLIDTLNQIVQSKQAMDIDGQMVDMQTANMLVQIHGALNPENQSKFDLIPLQKLVEWGWSRTSGGGAQTPPATPGTPPGPPQQAPAPPQQQPQQQPFAANKTALGPWQTGDYSDKGMLDILRSQPGGAVAPPAGSQCFCGATATFLITNMGGQKVPYCDKHAAGWIRGASLDKRAYAEEGYDEHSYNVDNSPIMVCPECVIGDLVNPIRGPEVRCLGCGWEGSNSELMSYTGSRKEGSLSKCAVCDDPVRYLGERWRHLDGDWKHTAAPKAPGAAGAMPDPADLLEGAEEVFNTAFPKPKYLSASNPYMPGGANPYSQDQNAGNVGVPADGMDGPAPMPATPPTTTTNPTTTKPRQVPSGGAQMQPPAMDNPGSMPADPSQQPPSGGMG